jgi:hypothetical protein
LEQKSGNLREHPSKDQFIEADNLVLESKQKEELQLEVKWQTASTNSEENTMLVKVHASDDVEAVRLISKTVTRVLKRFQFFCQIWVIFCNCYLALSVKSTYHQFVSVGEAKLVR